jgi:hypothetical protein
MARMFFVVEETVELVLLRHHTVLSCLVYLTFQLMLKAKSCTACFTALNVVGCLTACVYTRFTGESGKLYL